MGECAGCLTEGRGSSSASRRRSPQTSSPDPDLRRYHALVQPWIASGARGACPDRERPSPSRAPASRSIGSIGDVYDNALAESTIGLFENEAIRDGSPFRAGLELKRAALARPRSLPSPAHIELHFVSSSSGTGRKSVIHVGLVRLRVRRTESGCRTTRNGSSRTDDGHQSSGLQTAQRVRAILRSGSFHFASVRSAVALAA